MDVSIFEMYWMRLQLSVKREIVLSVFIIQENWICTWMKLNAITNHETCSFVRTNEQKLHFSTWCSFLNIFIIFTKKNWIRLIKKLNAKIGLKISKNCLPNRIYPTYYLGPSGWIGRLIFKIWVKDLKSQISHFLDSNFFSQPDSILFIHKLSFV